MTAGPLRWATCFLLLAGLLGMASTGHAKGGTTPTVTIRLEDAMSAKGSSAEMAAALAGFEKKYKHIKVAYSEYQGDFESHLEAEFLSGPAPDVFEIDMGWARDFIQAHALESLSGYAGHDRSFHPSDFSPSLVNGFSSRGRTYAYPIGYSTLGVFFNRALFKAGHIKYAPRDWKSFSRIACELTNKEDHVYGAVLSPDPARWFAFLPAFGARALNGKQNGPAINSKAAIAALKWYAGLVRSGCAELAPAGSSDAQEIGEGHAAMTFEPSSEATYLNAAFPKTGWGTSVLPTGPKGNGNLAFAVGYAMNGHSKYKNAAWKLISYLSDGGSAENIDRTAHFLPGRRSQRPPKTLSNFAKGAAYATPWAWPPGLVVNAFPEIGSDIAKAATGQMTYKNAVADMAVWLRRYL
ncbi:MAG TPA: extracellular solute-binding protein [Chloroflexota bacterium]|nr:extracellular solute-binding protein [Chloroflexota bacterium]